MSSESTVASSTQVLLNNPQLLALISHAQNLRETIAKLKNIDPKQKCGEVQDFIQNAEALLMLSDL